MAEIRFTNIYASKISKIGSKRLKHSTLDLHSLILTESGKLLQQHKMKMTINARPRRRNTDPTGTETIKVLILVFNAYTI